MSELLNSVLEAVKEEVNVTSTYCCSDSMVELWWIKEDHKRWSAWVQKRVDIIRSSTPSNIWFHVPSSSNPADISTCSSSLVHLHLSHWFMGPYFLSQNPIFWPSKDIFLQSEGKGIEEKIEMVATNTVGSSNLGVGKIIDCHRYDSLNKLLRITGYVLRFKANILAKW